MRIKKFLENNTEQERLSIIKECFFNITDNYDFGFKIQEINNSFFKMILNIGKPIDVNNIENVKDLSNRYATLSNIYKEIYISVKRLEEYDLSLFEISLKSEQEIKIDFYFKTSNINDFLFYPDEYTIAQDKNKLKLFFKNTFNVTVKNSTLSETIDRDGDYNIALEIACENIPHDIDITIKDFFNSLKADTGQRIFRSIGIQRNYICAYTGYSISNFYE